MRFGSLVFVIVVAAVGGAVTGTGQAQSNDRGWIDMTVRAAPDVAPSVDLRLVLDGIDVTDAECEPSTLDGVDIVCPDLDDGRYTIEPSGVPAGARTEVRCTDIVATPATEPVIDVDGGFFFWSCEVYVGTPAATSLS